LLSIFLVSILSSYCSSLSSVSSSSSLVQKNNLKVSVIQIGHHVLKFENLSPFTTYFLEPLLSQWKSKKQSCISFFLKSRISYSYHYRLWVTILSFARFTFLVFPDILYCDNQVPRHITYNLTFHKKNKTLTLIVIFIKTKFNNIFYFFLFRLHDQLANIFTKLLNILPSWILLASLIHYPGKVL